MAIWLLLALLLWPMGHALDNGLALTPPMGWNSWERFRCTIDCQKRPKECISEWLVKRTADAMVGRGYLSAGYQYVVIDDCWQAERRDQDANLSPDPTRFPSGILDLSRYIHSLGMKFGIYSNFGQTSCAGYPGTYTDIYKDADLFAKWEVDFVKLDGCNSTLHEKEIGFPAFGHYLNQTGRPMVYSCSLPAYQVEKSVLPDFECLKTYCNLWRFYDDIEDSWESVSDIMRYCAKNQDIYAPHAGPGHWNDPDMLVIGNFGLSIDQAKAQMAIWAILAAPLFISTDLDTIRPEFEEILLNKDIIEVNQDLLGIQGRKINTTNNIETWRKPILPVFQEYHSYAIAFLSRRVDGSPYSVTFSLNQLGLYNPNGYIIKDLFEGSMQEIKSGFVRAKVNPSGVLFFKFTPIPDDCE